MEKQPRPPSLLELQSWVRWIVTDPRGVQGALDEPFPPARPNLERYTSPATSAWPWIKESATASRVERLTIYAEAYFARILESMGSDFPITARILGPNSFAKVILDYLKTHPSRTQNIGEIGRQLANFIATYEDLATAPFLLSLVSCEWNVIESFYAPESAVLDMANVSTLTDDDWGNTVFKFTPSLRCVESRWPLHQFWKLRDETTTLLEVDLSELNEIRGFLIARQGAEVAVRSSSPGEFKILQSLLEGNTLAQALEQAQILHHDAKFEIEVSTWFRNWVGFGYIAEITIKHERPIS